MSTLLLGVVTVFFSILHGYCVDDFIKPLYKTSCLTLNIHQFYNSINNVIGNSYDIFVWSSIIYILRRHIFIGHDVIILLLLQ